MYVLDTNIMQYFHANDPRVITRLSSIPDYEVATTIISRCEILRARTEYLLKAADAEQLQRAQHWLAESEKLLRQIAILTFNDVAGANWAKLIKIRGLGRVGRSDLLIACVTLANDAILVTRNMKDFIRIPNLKLENWIDNS